jgi:large subunit ribosomal protein L25
VGEAPAAKLPDALITQALHVVTVECLPADIPQSVDVDISDLTAMEMSIHIRDVQPPANVTLVAEGEVLVVRVGQSRVSAAAEAIEAAEVEEGAVEAEAEGAMEASTGEGDGA